MLTINMSLEGARKLRDPFNNAALRAVPFIEKWRDNSQPRPMQRCAHALHLDLHDLAPASEDEHTPEPRPSNRLRLVEVAAPQFLRRVGIEDGCGSQSL